MKRIDNPFNAVDHILMAFFQFFDSPQRRRQFRFQARNFGGRSRGTRCFAGRLGVF